MAFSFFLELTWFFLQVSSGKLLDRSKRLVFFLFYYRLKFFLHIFVSLTLSLVLFFRSFRYFCRKIYSYTVWLQLFLEGKELVFSVSFCFIFLQFTNFVHFNFQVCHDQIFIQKAGNFNILFLFHLKYILTFFFTFLESRCYNRGESG